MASANYKFRLGANNLFDKSAAAGRVAGLPRVFCNGNTYSQVYDALGRYIYAGVTLDF